MPFLVRFGLRLVGKVSPNSQLIDNAGSGGNANSGNALGLRHVHEHEPALDDIPVNVGSFSGAAGEAPGGSAYTMPDLINIVSSKLQCH